MAAPFPLFVLCCIYCFFLLCIHLLPCASSFLFSHNFTRNSPDPCDNEICCNGSAQWAKNSMIELTASERTGDISDSHGQVWYRTPVRLWDAVTGEVACFNTTFTFQITPDKDSQVTGDGMAFFLTHYPPVDLGHNSRGGNLGVFNDSKHFNATGDGRVVAVEFDTFMNPDWDPDNSNQHIGIDVNSIRSVAWRSVGNLTSGVPMTATVIYNNRTKLLAVDLQISDTWYSVNATVDLARNLPDTVAIGFSAATGWFAEMHRVQSWSFSSTLDPIVPPAPASEPLPVAPIRSEPSMKWVLIPTAFVSVCAIVGLLWLWQKRRRPNDVGSESDEQADPLERGVAGPRRYLYRELAAATADFAEENMLGRGGFGSVYQGRLPSGGVDDGQQVAIKKISLESSQGRKEFEAEVKIISRLRHRNLVQLLGWCDSLKGLLLVYELVPQGSLEKHIYNTQRVLTWTERYKIILGLGSALQYLHQDCQECVVHGDIKPSNIMLDSSYNIKLGDFGLARLVDHGTGPQTTANVQGTIGYIDPEFVNSLRRSTESDVYSFGIVLLEIVSGRRPVDRQEPSFMLPKWVWSHYSQGSTLDAADARLRGDDADERQMERALLVGLWCAQHDSGQRPSVEQAMHVVQSEDAQLPALPPQMYMLPPVRMMSFSIGGSAASGSSISSGVSSSATTDADGDPFN